MTNSFCLHPVLAKTAIARRIARFTMASGMATSQIVLALACLALCCFCRLHRSSPSQLPPGPPGLPFVGNVGDLPPNDSPTHKHWLKHHLLYGPITSVTVMGQTMILLHEREAAIELLEKRSLKHSSRPFMRFALEM